MSEEYSGDDFLKIALSEYFLSIGEPIVFYDSSVILIAGGRKFKVTILKRPEPLRLIKTTQLENRFGSKRDYNKIPPKKIGKPQKQKISKR